MKLARSSKWLFALVLAGNIASPAFAEDLAGDPGLGEKVFKKCKACHQVGPEAKAKTGPTLNGIIGRAAGAEEDYKYSKAMMAAAENDSLTWTPENLDIFLTKPKDFLKGTKMSFAGLRKEEDRQNVIAYLATFKAEGG